MEEEGEEEMGGHSGHCSMMNLCKDAVWHGGFWSFGMNGFGL